ncbi:MAG: ester cyclase [Methylotenera sp.]
MQENQFCTAYFDAWNAHDAVALRAVFSDGGTYQDPSVGEVSGQKPELYAEHLWNAFPDLAFASAGFYALSANKFLAEWVMTGTNTGSLNGLPPSGKSVSLNGVDIIEVSDDGIQSVIGYFDSKAVPVQLGLNVIVQPFAVGPFNFGTSVSVQSGKKSKPGAFSITSIWNEQEETAEVQRLSRETMKEMMGMEGFIGITTARLGGRGITITAWEKPEQVSQIMHSPSHKEAMKQFWSNLSSAGYTSVWMPHHINPMWVRCFACKKMNDVVKCDGVCSCGKTLSEAPAYF